VVRVRDRTVRVTYWNLAYDVNSHSSSDSTVHAQRLFQCSSCTLGHKKRLPSATRWLHCVECPQYSIRLKAFGYLCTSCLCLAFDEAWCHVTQ